MEAVYFNRLLCNYCRRSKKVFFVDHGLQWLPPTRVLAADGLHERLVDLVSLGVRVKLGTQGHKDQLERQASK
ncbi:hypothetical protein MTO96_021687 [Rhipicephalus appendiculatus]